MKKYIIAILVLFLFSNLEAGPWPKNAGEGYFKLSEYWIIADQHYTDIGGIDPNVTNGFFSTSIYAEYGLTNRLTAQVYFPFFSRAYFNNTLSGTTGDVIIEGESINSLGDAEIGLTFGIIRGSNYSVSISGGLGLPFGKTGGTLNNLQTGDGEFNQYGKIEAGYSFSLGGNNGWMQAYVGYNNRTEGFSDETLAGFQIGLDLGKFIPSVRIDSRQSRFNGDTNLALNSTSIFSNNVEYISFTPELVYKLNDRWGISAAAGFVSSGRLIFASPSFNVGISYDLR